MLKPMQFQTEKNRIKIRKHCDQIWRNFATWTNFQNLRQTFDCLFCFWQNFKPTLAIFTNFGQV